MNRRAPCTQGRRPTKRSRPTWNWNSTPIGEAGEKPTGDDDQIDDPIRIYLMQMGEIPLLTPGGRDRGRQADQAGPPPLPPHHAGHRLRAARGHRHAEEHPRRAVAAGSHDRSLGDQHSREEATDEGPHSQPADAGPHHGAGPQGFCGGDPQAPAPQAASYGLEAADRPTRPGRAPDRGTRPADAAFAADPGQAQAGLAADGRTARTDPPAQGPAGTGATAGRAEERALPTDEDHAGEPRHAPPPHRADQRPGLRV